MPPSSPRATITDVAKAAGVALGTVSRVFNHHPDVNTEIRDHVMNTARKLGYSRIRRRATSAPVTVPSIGAVGVVIFGMDDTLVQLPIVSSALQGIEQALSAGGRNLMLATIANGNRLPPFLESDQVKGVIIKGPNQGVLPPEGENELLRQLYRLPRVWLMGRLPNARGDHCNFDTEAAGRIAAEHLLAKGHRRVAFMNPKPGQIQFEKVKASFQLACSRGGLKCTLLEVEAGPPLAWPLPSTTRQENVDRLVDEWNTLPVATRPTALFVPSDRTATQLYAALAQRRLRPGRDVSVISCNNEKSLLVNLHPALTTIDVHAELIGRRAVDLLLWRMAHPAEVIDSQVLIEPALIAGDSVAQLPSPAGR